MHREGDRLVIEPVRKRGLVALLATMTPYDEAFPEIDDPPPAPETIFRCGICWIPASFRIWCGTGRDARRGAPRRRRQAGSQWA